MKCWLEIIYCRSHDLGQCTKRQQLLIKSVCGCGIFVFVIKETQRQYSVEEEKGEGFCVAYQLLLVDCTLYGDIQQISSPDD